MNNKELNLCKILKDCPKGTKLYSPMLGEVWFYNTSSIGTCNICVYKECKSYHWFTFDGRFALSSQTFSDEVMLFPSKDNRDWSTWKNPKPKVERFDPKTLKPFDKVLIKHNYEGERWVCNFFSDILLNGEIHCIGVTVFECVPYNDDTKHLIGTCDEAPEYYRYWED